MRYFVIGFVATVSLAACAENGSTNGQSNDSTITDAATQWLGHPNRITSTEVYNSTFVGKTLLSDDASFFVGPNGEMTGSGQAGGNPFTFSGAYEFKDGFYCRWNGVMNGEPIPDDCQVVILENGKNVTLVRNSGKGKVVNYTLVNQG